MPLRQNNFGFVLGGPMKFLVINGPNLNMLGIREPDIYGRQTYEDLVNFCKQVGKDKKVVVDCYQSNHEGDLVDEIQKAFKVYDGIVINPGAYTHTSVAILDALKAVAIPTVEVHISDVDSRESFRQISYIRSYCIRTITGLGFEGYRVAIAALINHLVKLPDPYEIENDAYRYDAFDNGEVLLNKKTGRLPAMGWNSWNAFGTGNTEELTKQMADAMIDLGLDKLGYEYLVLDDGCYKPERVDGQLTNEPERFPSGFNALADYIHGKGLKFGMYNDIGTNLCSGAEVGTFNHEPDDAKNYAKWDIDYLKVDNCYYMWDDATFSDKERVKFVFTPNIRGIEVKNDAADIKLNAVKDGVLRGAGAVKNEEADFVTHIGTFDGTGPMQTPVGDESSELTFTVNAPESGEYDVLVEYASGYEIGAGQWLQLAVGDGTDTKIYYDYLLPATKSTSDFAVSEAIKVNLNAGENVIRVMNHRRQENTLCSYATMLKELKKAAPDRDILLSLCEWGKNQPQNWAYKVGESWRILNDITFRVGHDGYPGDAAWYDDYTPSITSQYNKAVIMDEFAGLDKGWNDPDMLVVGMNGLTDNMNRTHMAMWCMLNSPLMLGIDFRRVKKGDAIYNTIANKNLIDLNQDKLGIQAKRVQCTVETEGGKKMIANPDTEYVRDKVRVDILAKPLADGSVAVSFINISDKDWTEKVSIDVKTIVDAIGSKMCDMDAFANAASYKVTDLWNGEETVCEGMIAVDSMEACGNVTVKVSPVA